MGRKRSKSLFVSNETVPTTDSVQLREKLRNPTCRRFSFEPSGGVFAMRNSSRVNNNNNHNRTKTEYRTAITNHNINKQHVDDSYKCGNMFSSNRKACWNLDLPLSFLEDENDKMASKSLHDTSIRILEKCDACGQAHYFVNPSNVSTTNDNNHLLNIAQETPMTSLLYRSRSLPQLSFHDSGVASGNDQIHGRPTSRLASDLRQLLTLKQHYYPEGGWGWIIVIVGVIVQVLSHGLHGAVAILLLYVNKKFGSQPYFQAECLGAMSAGMALIISPITITFCRKKSTRITAVFGGLITALGCLFTSFASQFHQLYFSYGTFVGIGVGIIRDCCTLMVAQYFKRKREYVEIFIVSGSGLGIVIMSTFIKGAISKLGWRVGLQAVTGVVFCTFILGMFYRSASLYHPQRRAILHLKNQKRKIKDNSRGDEKLHFFDFSIFRSKTIRIMLTSTCISAFGINIPIFYLVHEANKEGLSDSVIILQIYLGLAWMLGCVSFGFLIVYNNVECRIARQYLTQAAGIMCGLCILAFTAVHGNYQGYVMFTWIYGIFCGGYHYSLKMYTYERVRGRNFAKAWGFIQCSQAIPTVIGVPMSGYISMTCGEKIGYYFSSMCVFLGSLLLFLIDLHKRKSTRHKHTSNGKKHLCTAYSCPQRRRLSFIPEPEHEGIITSAAAAALVLNSELVPPQDMLGTDKPELTCISEEGIADMDIPDNLLDDIDYIGDCITSCNKVENYLMLSEFENNLIAEMPIITDRRVRRWSETKAKSEALKNDQERRTSTDTTDKM